MYAVLLSQNIFFLSAKVHLVINEVSLKLLATFTGKCKRFLVNYYNTFFIWPVWSWQTKSISKYLYWLPRPMTWNEQRTKTIILVEKVCPTNILGVFGKNATEGNKNIGVSYIRIARSIEQATAVCGIPTKKFHSWTSKKWIALQEVEHLKH